MRKLPFALAMALAAPSAGWSLGFAQAARLNVGDAQLAVGQKTAKADELLDCRASAVQHTVRQCALKPGLVRSSSSAGHRVKSAALTVNFQGEVVNMSVEFEAGLGFDVLLEDYSAALSAKPKVQYWADDEHLYASYVWIDDDTEVEISRTIKGPAPDGAVRVFVSSLAGNQALSPEDAP